MLIKSCLSLKRKLFLALYKILELILFVLLITHERMTNDFVLKLEAEIELRFSIS